MLSHCSKLCYRYLSLHSNQMVFFISSMMLKTVLVLVVFFLVGLTDAGQERVKVLNLVTNLTPMVLQSYSHSVSNVAVSVYYQHLDGISSSVLMAESWLKTNVLTHYPAVQITTIVVGKSVLCNNTQEEQWDLVLPSMKNIYYSVVRWGLEKDIKVSAFLSTECLHPFSYTYREGLVDRVIKPLLEFLQNTANSSVTLSVPSYYSPLVTAHKESISKLGNFLQSSNEINVVISSSSKERKPKSRKLSFLSSSKVVVVDPFPARPTPLPKMPSSPLHSSIGVSIPAQIAKPPLPPLVQTPPTPLISYPYAPQSSTFPPLAQISPPSPISFPFAPQTAQPPSMYFYFGPESPPLGIPSNPPDVEPYPPCYAPPTTPVAPTPKPGQGNKGMWCVAKPSVPAEKLKEALDYACGVGGGDCGEIKPQGSCYYPDTMVAHASYAFNSYWQKNKNKGGTCNFGGTAMLINANPSYQQCKFIIS
ncbi:Glucan endo-1,3-beta-glucosidase [Thalictrum thalictroides]|uniref:Glucan endo-1,3-beta-glucosidase n=1 Tax=Thalictrum thalictroides TaxID=46969 RepID=A0A7J6VQ33_THATH|nr:Glucan endo-1,3-beta-glucosidase [Thalictrum thalictroides]